MRMTETNFLNSDLDLRSEAGLDDLLKAFGSSVISLRRESDNCLSIELEDQPQTVDESILSFYKLVQELSSKARAIWDNCEVRSINIGIQAGTNPYSKEFCISKESISLLSSMNCEIVFTVYSIAEE